MDELSDTMIIHIKKDSSQRATIKVNIYNYLVSNYIFHYKEYSYSHIPLI